MHSVYYVRSEAILKCKEFVSNTSLVSKYSGTDSLQGLLQGLVLFIIVEVHVPDDPQVGHNAFMIDINKQFFPVLTMYAKLVGFALVGAT